MKNNFLIKILKVFLNSLIYIDYLLFKMSALLLIPFLCILEDILVYFRKAFIKYMYFRSLFIFSNRKYGSMYFLNKLSIYYSLYFNHPENLLYFISSKYKLSLYLDKLKNFYYNLKYYDERLMPKWSFVIPIMLLKSIFVPFLFFLFVVRYS
jgi:hypothetical protein